MEFTSGSHITLNEKGIRGLYETFKLPLPTISNAVISMELRKAISEFGIVYVEIDDEDAGVAAFVPPSAISTMRFHVFDADKYCKEECDLKIEEHLNFYKAVDGE